MKRKAFYWSAMAAGFLGACAQAQDKPSGTVTAAVANAADCPPRAVEISLPDTIYAIVGDKLQLFYRGLIADPNPYNYDILVACAKGSQYPRYFEYTPTTADVGVVAFDVQVRDGDCNVLGRKTCKLVTKSVARSPAAMINVLCLGDSLTAGGVWCKESSRRLVGAGGAPAGLSLSNIAFVGRVTAGGIGWEGNGGWSWGDYTASGRPAYRFYVSGVTTPPALNAVYTIGDKKFIVAEINITGDAGNIRCVGYNGAPTPSGALTKATGAGDESITFSSFAADAGNPFWNAAAKRLDVESYANRYCNGRLDVVYALLSWNGQTPFRTDFSGSIKEAKILFDHMRSVYPNVKIKLMGLQLPSLNGGMGANYGATGTGYSDTYGMVITALNMNRAFQEFAGEKGYADFVEFVNVSSQFDSENNMPEQDVPVNSRSAKTEKRGVNGVHPAQAGYFQIADAVFRNFVANFCQ